MEDAAAGSVLTAACAAVACRIRARAHHIPREAIAFYEWGKGFFFDPQR